MEPLAVTISKKTYPIRFSASVSAQVHEKVSRLTQSGRASAVLTDEGVASAQSSFLDGAFAGIPRLVVARGEASKSIPVFGRALEFLAEQKLSRQGVLWVVGGGIPGDLGGFVAASYLRGIDFIQIPTTLLAMVDSSVGGKTGLNLPAGKNLVGAFHHPEEVLIGTDFLQTLPAREFAAGTAEILKYGLLGDRVLFDRLAQAALTPVSDDLSTVIRRCCEMKAEIVRVDEFETAAEGGRALLNLGHTFGHAIEQVTRFEQYLHGEAVGVGLVAAAHLSQRLGYLDSSEVLRIETAVAAHALPVRLRAPLRSVDLMAAMQHDKKVRAGRLRFVVLKRLGEAATQSDIEPSAVETVWRALGAT